MILKPVPRFLAGIIQGADPNSPVYSLAFNSDGISWLPSCAWSQRMMFVVRQGLVQVMDAASGEPVGSAVQQGQPGVTPLTLKGMEKLLTLYRPELQNSDLLLPFDAT
jgi:hypothetical protein